MLKVEDWSFPNYVFEIGVFSEKTKRREKVHVGVTNAEIMFINENGSPLNHIPARPVLKMTFEWALESGELIQGLSKAIAVYTLTNDLNETDKEMNRLAVKLQNYARNIIYSNDGRLTPNAQSTIARKGDNHPLFDTGQLARSITCRAVRI